MSDLKNVWIFNGASSRLPVGIFSTRTIADEWIFQYKLTGVLTSYPLDIGVYDWAVQNEFFIPDKEAEKTAVFIQRFTSASQEHYHYEDGVEG